VTIGPETLEGSALEVGRRIFVPSDGRFIRILSTVHNSGTTPVDASTWLQNDHYTPGGDR